MASRVIGLVIVGGIVGGIGDRSDSDIGEALYQYRDRLPTYRAHNEQDSGHGFGKLLQLAYSNMAVRLALVLSINASRCLWIFGWHNI
jgi:3D-(3,5/4)-trihydroxycyclohexane-1,2-dione acylhydrolase (decyclizing)